MTKQIIKLAVPCSKKGVPPMTKYDILGVVQSEMSSYSGWEGNLHQIACDRILALFAENGISADEYEGWMCNNVLPAISLKG